MSDNSISVLLVGQNVQRSPELHWWLDNRELRCEYAESCHDACSRVSRRQYDLVISEYQLPDRTAFPLLDLWLLMLDRGRRCVGAPVVRSRNLHGELDQALHAIGNTHDLERFADELTSTPFLKSVSR
jgi:CheY-like chemotaxis protein